MNQVLVRSAHWPHGRFSAISRAWPGETCCVIGGGMSLTPTQVDLTRGRCRVIAVNDAYRLAPWAEVCYFADSRWWGWHKARPEFQAFAGQKCTMENNGVPPVADTAVHVLRNHGTHGLSAQPDGLMTGQHSGYAAINFAVLAGATRILLLGFDMRDGTHWFGQHPVPTVDSEVKAWLANYQSIETPLVRAGVEVLNCTPGSALTRFPMMSIKEALGESSLSDPAAAVLSA